MKAIELINEYKKINGCSLKEFLSSTLKIGTPEHGKIEFQLFNAAHEGSDGQTYYRGSFYTPALASGSAEYLVISFGTKGTFDYSIDREISNEDNINKASEAFNDFIKKKFTSVPNRWVLSITFVALGINGTYADE